MRTLRQNTPRDSVFKAQMNLLWLFVQSMGMTHFMHSFTVAQSVGNQQASQSTQQSLPSTRQQQPTRSKRHNVQIYHQQGTNHQRLLNETPLSAVDTNHQQGTIGQLLVSDTQQPPQGATHRHSNNRVSARTLVVKIPSEFHELVLGLINLLDCLQSLIFHCWEMGTPLLQGSLSESLDIWHECAP